MVAGELCSSSLPPPLLPGVPVGGPSKERLLGTSLQRTVGHARARQLLWPASAASFLGPTRLPTTPPAVLPLQHA